MLSRLLASSSLEPAPPRKSCLLMIESDDEDCIGDYINRHILASLSKTKSEQKMKIAFLSLKRSQSQLRTYMNDVVNFNDLMFIDGFQIPSTLSNSNLFPLLQYFDTKTTSMVDLWNILDKVYNEANFNGIDKEERKSPKAMPLFVDGFSVLLRRHSLARVLQFLQKIRFESKIIRFSPIVIQINQKSISKESLLALQDLSSVLITCPSPSVINDGMKDLKEGSSSAIGSLEVRHMKNSGKVASESMWVCLDEKKSNLVTLSTIQHPDNLLFADNEEGAIDSKASRKRDVLNEEQKLAKDSVILPYLHQGETKPIQQLIVRDDDDPDLVDSDDAIDSDGDGLDDDLDL